MMDITIVLTEMFFFFFFDKIVMDILMDIAVFLMDIACFSFWISF